MLEQFALESLSMNKPLLHAGLEACIPEYVRNHPDDLLLIDYVDGRLAPEKKEALTEHLAWCKTCADLVLGFSAMDAPNQTDLDDQIVEQQWEALQKSMPNPPQLPHPPANEPAIILPFYKRLSFAYTLAAACMVFALISITAEHEKGELIPAPFEFVKDEGMQRGPTNRMVISNNRLMLDFMGFEDDLHKSYETHIFENGVLAERVPTVMNEYGVLKASFVPKSPSGELKIEVVGIDAGKETILQTYYRTYGP